MMKLKQYLLALALVLGGLSMVQAQSTKKMLTKGWRFSFEGMMENMPEIEKQQMSKMSEEQRTKMKAMIEQSYIVFKSGGTAKASMNGKEEEMTWKLSDNDKLLTTTEKNGKVSRLKIIKITKDSLVLQEESDTKGVMLVFKPKVD
ncbi:lipocalin family protein [Microscilla marina]|uniref:Lipocalin-like domain-containing protein n=1 Tax=Microscilla marina ATCC 23134 TaxID=313606 RepID=A1ZJJ7_MICM2|nr:lipocalin family protein [Microscilla marina]EAY29300.1 hypothetical protein M23134_01354 [Microscilla marina ATCC 23134]